MCDLNKKHDGETFTGYKIVTKNESGQYISPCTGITYEVGMVSQNITRETPVIKYFTYLKCILNGYAYKENMRGRTCVFRLLEDAEFIAGCMGKEENNLIIIKMTLSQNLMSGEYGNFSVVGGKHIDKIEQLDK